MAEENVVESVEQEVVEENATEIQLEDTGQEGSEKTSNAGSEKTLTEEDEAEVKAEETETEEKTFTQEELDAVIDRRLARERRKTEREQAARARESIPLKIESQLDPDSFETTEDYITALADERVGAIIAQKEQNKVVNAAEEKYQTQIDEAIDKYPDYIQVAHTHEYMTEGMAAAIKSSDIAIELAYHLGSNLEEAKRIFHLPSVQQIKELGRLEMTLEKTLPKVKTSSAPAPIKPVQRGKTIATVFDTTDPRSAGQLSCSDWIAKDRLRRGFK